MKVLGKLKLKKYWEVNRESKKPLQRWLGVVNEAQWNNFAEVRNTFNDASYVNGKVVFNIKRNDYRLLVLIAYNTGTIVVLNIGTHSEYEKWEL